MTEAIADQLAQQLINDPPESIVGGLAILIDQKDKMQPTLYRELMRLMSATLAMKCQAACGMPVKTTKAKA